MNQKEKNLQAIDAYVKNKNLIINNGEVRMFSANAEYINLKTNTTTVLHNTQIYVSTIYPYGGYSIKISELQDVEGCFVEHNTNFSTFNYANERLTIKGRDKNNIKGDYTLVLY